MRLRALTDMYSIFTRAKHVAYQEHLREATDRYNDLSRHVSEAARDLGDLDARLAEQRRELDNKR